MRGCAKKEAKNAHAYGSLHNSLYFCIVFLVFLNKHQFQKKKHDGMIGKQKQKKERNGVLTRKRGINEPASNDCVGNKRCAVRK
jgi:hypothetical protein